MISRVGLSTRVRQVVVETSSHVIADDIPAASWARATPLGNVICPASKLHDGLAKSREVGISETGRACDSVCGQSTVWRQYVRLRVYGSSEMSYGRGVIR